ncbi:MAG TPA: lysylphosphatidylglycerol synthase domain-containing protein [Gaiellaceae bacterium]|nr:lysylphosphatidylglycerol synthase domain-containing protein [Gaiellaceae bacterium]
MSRFRTIAGWANAHRRLLGIAQIVLLVVFFGSLGWALRGSLHSAAHDLDHANLVLFGLGCAALGAYYLVFVLGWMRILAEWGIELSYPAALRAEMISMLAKYVPGGIWTPAARVVAARRAGITDAALVTSSMLLEAGISAVAGVIVFVLSLGFVDNVDAPLWPLIVFGVVLAVLVQPRVFRPLAHKVLGRFGYTRELPNLRGRTITGLLLFYSGTWVLGGFALWLLLRSVGARPEAATIVFLGGTAAVGAIVAVLFIFAPSGLGPREASMYGLLLAVTSPGRALGAVALNRVALTAVELVLLLVGGVLLRGRAPAPPEPVELPSL